MLRHECPKDALMLFCTPGIHLISIVVRCRYGGRFDCPSMAEIVVVLDDGTDVLPPYTGINPSQHIRSYNVQ